MEVVEWVLGGQVQQDIVMMINEVGGKAVGLTGKDGCLIQATKKLMADQNNPGQWLDIGYVGDISRIEPAVVKALQDDQFRSEEHTSELQSLMRISYAVFCLKKKQQKNKHHTE